MIALAAAAEALSRLVVVGGSHPVEPVLVALLLGLLAGNLRIVPGACASGVKAYEKALILGIVLLGSSFTLEALRSTAGALVVILVTMSVSFWLILFFARLFGLPRKLGMLLGVGTCICGGTAIAVTSPLIEAGEDETSYAVGVVTICGLLAMIVLPLVGSFCGLGDRIFGIWAGTSVHNTPQTVGAGFMYSNAAGEYATVTKLCRNLFIFPVAMAVSLWHNRRRADVAGAEARAARAFPWFLLGYFVMAILAMTGFFTKSGVANFVAAGKFLIVVAMAGIGLRTDLRNLRRLGLRPLAAGLLASVVVAIVSLSLASMIVPE
jgi:uncharacterized integral membrane protein (TIGR00698 family)